MIKFDSTTRNEYKDYNREIKVVGNLYLTTKEISSNVFTYNVSQPYFTNYATASKDNEKLKITSTNTTNRSTYVMFSLPTSQILGKKIYFSCYFQSTSLYPQIYLFGMKNGSLVAALMGNYQNNVSAGKLSFTYTFPDEMPSQYDRYTIGFYARTSIRQDVQSDDYTSYYDISISPKGYEYEPYGTYVYNYNALSTTSKNLFDSFHYFYNNYEGFINDYHFRALKQQNEFVFDYPNLNTYYETLYPIKLADIGMTVNNNYVFSCKAIPLSSETHIIISLYYYNQNNELISSTTESFNQGFIELPFTIPLNTNNFVLRLSLTNINPIREKLIVENMQMEEGTNATYYERYNTAPFRLNQDDTKILGFNINSKTDIFYTSLPYNTMSLEINNENQYFSDYSNNSITEYLNQYCYIDLFMKINDGGYYKIMTMNFDKISYSDYEKARLNFKSSIALLKQSSLMGSYLYAQVGATWLINMLQLYLNDYYLIGLKTENMPDRRALNIKSRKSSTLEGMVLQCCTLAKYNNTSPSPALISTNYNDIIILKNIVNILSESYKETLNKKQQLEKPTIKKQNDYNGVDYYTFDETTLEYNDTTDTYTYKLKDKIKSKEYIVIRNDDIKMNEITNNDITITGATYDVVSSSSDGKEPILSLRLLSGNIGDEYEISINKANIKRRKPDNSINNKYGDTSDKSKILVINEASALYGEYYDYLFNTKKVESYVEIQCMGLPYLEIGDKIRVQLDNGYVQIVITEIDMNFDGGLTMYIKGYKIENNT